MAGVLMSSHSGAWSIRQRTRRRANWLLVDMPQKVPGVVFSQFLTGPYTYPVSSRAAPLRHPTFKGTDFDGVSHTVRDIRRFGRRQRCTVKKVLCTIAAVVEKVQIGLQDLALRKIALTEPVSASCVIELVREAFGTWSSCRLPRTNNTDGRRTVRVDQSIALVCRTPESLRRKAEYNRNNGNTIFTACGVAFLRVHAVSSLADFLHRLLEQGSVILSERPVIDASEHTPTAAWLQSVYADYRLDVAGPLLPFDAAISVSAAECCRGVCWLLVDRRAPPEEVETLVTMPDPTGSAAQHLSVDLIFRFLPQLYSRARAIDPEDVLTRALAKLCCHWPLSGILADVPDKPVTPLEFGGHPGLQLLYAERFVQQPRPAWMPQGTALEYVNLVVAERGDNQ